MPIFRERPVTREVNGILDPKALLPQSSPGDPSHGLLHRGCMAQEGWRGSKGQSQYPSKGKVFRRPPHTKLGFQRAMLSPSGPSQSKPIPLSQPWGPLGPRVALRKTGNQARRPRYSNCEMV